MSLERCALRMAGLWLVLALAGSAQAQGYLLGGVGDGGQLQFGSARPLPLQPVPVLPLPSVFPPLLVTPVPGVTIFQPLTSLQGGTIMFPANVLSRSATGIPVAIGVFAINPVNFQVATSISFAWPAAPATFSVGGAPAGGFVFAGGTITYGSGAKMFGGAARFALSPGPGAAGGAIPGSPVTTWINYLGQLPATAMTALLVGATLGPLAQPGASTLAAPHSTMGVTPNPGFAGALSVAPSGTILMSIPIGVVGLTNMLFSSKGYPWATGLITIAQPGPPAQLFFLSGTDMRLNGIGNISLVSGALSTRALSGPSANRGWLSLTLPEPAAVVGLAGMLAILGLCHQLALRRAR